MPPRFRSALAALALAACFLTACRSDNYYRAEVEASGGGSAQAFHVEKGVKTPVTDRYVATGSATATVQSIKPYLTLDGSWSRDSVPGAGAPVEEGDSVKVNCPGGVCRVPGAAAPAAAPSCGFPAPGASGYVRLPAPPPPQASPRCRPPEARPTPYAPYPKTPGDFQRLAPPCDPAPPGAAAPAGRTCDQPVYRGCSGVEGGNRPRPIGDLDPQIEPGTGWPCRSAGPVGNAVFGGPVLVVGGFAHVGICTFNYVRCLFSLP